MTDIVKQSISRTHYSTLLYSFDTLEAEALAKFSALDLTDMANINPADVVFLGAVNDIANQAEVGAFNAALKTATGDAKTALQVRTPCLSPCVP